MSKLLYQKDYPQDVWNKMVSGRIECIRKRLTEEVKDLNGVSGVLTSTNIANKPELEFVNDGLGETYPLSEIDNVLDNEFRMATEYGDGSMIAGTERDLLGIHIQVVPK